MLRCPSLRIGSSKRRKGLLCSQQHQLSIACHRRKGRPRRTPNRRARRKQRKVSRERARINANEHKLWGLQAHELTCKERDTLRWKIDISEIKSNNAAFAGSETIPRYSKRRNK